MILSKPWCGWCPIEIGGLHLGSASYLTDVANDFLDALLQFFVPDNVLPFGITFDGEGYEFGILSISDELYAYTTATATGVPELHAIYEDLGLRDAVHDIGMQVCDDISANIREWASWVIPESKEEFEKNKKILLLKIGKLRDTIGVATE